MKTEETIFQRMKRLHPDKIGVCRLCGREGYWDKRPASGGTRNFLAHSCPVQRQKTKDKKEKLKQGAIDRDIRAVKNNSPSGTSFGHLIITVLLDFDLYDETVDPDNIFSEHTERGKTYHKAWFLVHEEYLQFITDKRKYPTKAQLKKMVRLTVQNLKKFKII